MKQRYFRPWKYFNRITKIRTESLRCQTALINLLFCTEEPWQLSILIEPFFIYFSPSFQIFSCPWNHCSLLTRRVLPVHLIERLQLQFSWYLLLKAKLLSSCARAESHILLCLCRAVGPPQQPLFFRTVGSFSTDIYI